MGNPKRRTLHTGSGEAALKTLNKVSDHVQLLRNGEDSNHDGGRKKLIGRRRASGINVAVAAIIISSLLLFFHLQLYDFKTDSPGKIKISTPISTSQNLAWCPNAACSNSALCQPCRQRFLFILSTGRAASTTLLGMINHLPNVRIGGENNNILHTASEIESKLEASFFGGLRSKVPARPPNSAWFHNEIPEQAMACTFQKVLQTINPPPEEIQQQIINSSSNGTTGMNLDDYETSQIIGAKMIRIQEGKWTALEASEFFKYNFPCAKFIMNTCLDIDRQAASQSKNLQAQATNKTIKKENDFLAQFAQHMGEEMARMIYMEEWTNSVAKLNEVVEWLGFSNCQYDKVLHNNKNGFYRDESPVDVGSGCRAP